MSLQSEGCRQMDSFSFPVLHNDAGRVELRPQMLGLARGNKESQIKSELFMTHQGVHFLGGRQNQGGGKCSLQPCSPLKISLWM